MNVNFEDLKLLPQMYELIEKLNSKLETTQAKRWLSVKELSNYLTFGKDKIYKMVDVQFIESEHYYRKENRLLFDKEKIDEWVLNSSSNTNFKSANEIINNVLNSVSK